VSPYSTAGGFVGVTSRQTRPSASRLFSVSDSIRREMSGTIRPSALKRGRLRQRKQDQDRPLVADAVQHLPDRTAVERMVSRAREDGGRNGGGVGHAVTPR
jgi:hypothetical protein